MKEPRVDGRFLQSIWKNQLKYYALLNQIAKVKLQKRSTVYMNNTITGGTTQA